MFFREEEIEKKSDELERACLMIGCGLTPGTCVGIIDGALVPTFASHLRRLNIFVELHELNDSVCEPVCEQQQLHTSMVAKVELPRT